MKKIILAYATLTTFTLGSCNTEPPPKKDDGGLKIEGKKGGDLEINKSKLEINGSSGGKLKVDSAGAVAK